MRIRVLNWGMPELLHEIIVQGFSHEPDLEIMAPRGSPMTLLEAIAKHRPDVVIMDIGQNRFETACNQLLWGYPRLKVVVLRNDGQEAVLCRFKLEQTPLEDVSLTSLASVIRQATSDPAIPNDRVQ
jgi:DNA-binding NarL/FixJ family response regulator